VVREVAHIGLTRPRLVEAHRDVFSSLKAITPAALRIRPSGWPAMPSWESCGSRPHVIKATLPSVRARVVPMMKQSLEFAPPFSRMNARRAR
jgi:hypothetical protein